MASLTFQFYDGFKQRNADPLAVLNRLTSTADYRPALIDEATGGNAKSVMRLSEIVRDAFNIQLLTPDGRGMTRLECVQLIDRYDRWTATLRNSTQAG